MSLWDYILPWEAIPNMIEDVKAAAKTTNEDGSPNYQSVFGAIGKYADPAGALMGDKWMDFFHGTIPETMNKAVQPWNEFHMKYLDPIQMAYGDELQPMGEIASVKGADLTAAALAATFGAMALGGAGGAAGGEGGGFSFNNPYDFSNMNWQDPNTYMQLAQNVPGGGPQQQQQQQPPQPPPQALQFNLPQPQPNASQVGQILASLYGV